MTELAATARELVASPRGILAIDESVATSKRFQALGITSTPQSRRDYRELLVGCPELATWISGAILYDETIRQTATDGAPLLELLKRQGIMTGVKVDTGTKGLALHPEETVTEGLDGLRGRIAEYVGMGVRFAKWRAVITIGDGRPSLACVHANAHALIWEGMSRGAALTEVEIRLWRR